VLPSEPSHQLALKHHSSILEVISQLWTKEGAWGVWKGSNATFVYSALWKTIETWSRSMLSALLNIPDPGRSIGLGVPADMTSSTYPWTSLGVAVTAAAMTGIILAPLDMVRTKLVNSATLLFIILI
jgi:mitochondrial fusion and transport protein UGO1